jgi:glucose dehydrogenase
LTTDAADRRRHRRPRRVVATFLRLPLDAASGARCADFGSAGEVNLNPGVGEELWKARLPAGGQATPMSYRVRPGGKQYVVIAAGGHGRGGTRLGDFIVAFALRD